MSEADSTQFGIVQLGEALIGIPIKHLSEVFHVDKEEHLPQASELLRCGIALRGQLIPVLDLQKLGRLMHATAKPSFGVIFKHKDRLLAIFVDQIVGITTLENDAIDVISTEQEQDHPIFSGVFAYNDKFVSLLDISHLFSLPDIYAARHNTTETGKSRKTLEPMLTFAAGGALYTVPAVEVHAAIHKQAIEKTAIAVGPCLGEITYHKRRIPVLCPVQILGLGTRETAQMPEIVALRFPGDLVLGFAVDEIHEIGLFAGAKETTVPIWQAERSFINKIIMREDGAQIYAIDLVALHAATDLQEIATLSKPEGEPPKEEEPLTTQKQNVTTTKERYLVIDADERLAIPLSEVNCIVEQPEKITATHFKKPGFCGYFSRSDESIALFDLGECRGRSAAVDPQAKILLTGQPGHQVGYLVNHVLGIEMSEWCEKPGADTTTPRQRLVQLGAGPTAQVLPTCSLQATLAANLGPSPAGLMSMANAASLSPPEL